MNACVIRHVLPSDVQALVPLMDQLGYPTDVAHLEKRLEIFARSDGYGIAVACVASDIVGLIAWSQAHLVVLDKVRFRIEGLVVDRMYRGQGIGKKLIEYLESYARSYRPSVIELTSNLQRAQDGTHAFYDALGYRNDGPKTTLYLRKDIP